MFQNYSLSNFEFQDYSYFNFKYLINPWFSSMLLQKHDLNSYYLYKINKMRLQEIENDSRLLMARIKNK